MSKCEKVAYESFAEAQAVVSKAKNIGRARNRHIATKKPKRTYKCEDCGLYHNTSKLKTNKKTVNKNKKITEDVMHFEYKKPEYKDKTLNIKTNT